MGIAVQANDATFGDHIANCGDELFYARIIRGIDPKAYSCHRIQIDRNHCHLEGNVAQGQIIGNVPQQFQAFWVEGVPWADILKANESNTWSIGRDLFCFSQMIGHGCCGRRHAGECCQDDEYHNSCSHHILHFLRILSLPVHVE